MKELAAVLIPIFQVPLHDLEKESLRSCNDHLGDFPLFFLVSESEKNRDELLSLCPCAKFIALDARYFANRRSYAKLLLSPTFYEEWGWARYILLLETSIIINRNELAYWCRQGYDLIQLSAGERLKPNWRQRLAKLANPASLLTAGNDEVVNYGQYSALSLRKVETFTKLTRQKSRSVHRFLSSSVPLWNDSLFWELYSNRWFPDLLVPNAISRNRFVLPNQKEHAGMVESDRPFAVVHSLSLLDLPAS